MDKLHITLVKRISEANDSNIGSATKQDNASVSGLVSTLVVNLVIFSIMVLIFMILRRTQKRMYMPKAFVKSIPEWRRIGSESIKGQDGFFSWIGGVSKADDQTVLRTAGLDGYFFLRYLKQARNMMAIGCVITFPILFPINRYGGGGQEGLDIISFSNCSKKSFYYAHVFVGYLFFSYLLYTIYRELVYYVNLRQAYMFSPLYAPRISARTVLITSVPAEYRSEAILRKVFDNVKRVWINFDTDELEQLVQERDEVAMKLEASEVKLIKMADAARRKKGDTAVTADGAEKEIGETSGSVAAQWLEKKKRPTHKTKFLVGEKVDTIDWCRGKLAELNPKVEELRERVASGEGERFNSAFIEFTSQSAAQVAVQTLAHHQALQMAPRYIGVTPAEIVWKNMKMGWLERLVKIVATTAFCVALVIFWSIPVAVVGLISQVNYLTEKLPWLSFINDIPPSILGLITALLPAIMLAVLMALLPIILRTMAKIAGAPSLSQIELTTQNSYFAFQVIQVFLVTTLSSAASSAVTEVIKNPGSTPGLLASSIPKASNFYIAFMILQGLSISAGALLQIVGLIVFKILSFLFDNTPRKMFNRWSTLSGIGWGTVFPTYTLITVIAITYSITAPLVLLFATIGLSLLYISYRYNLLFVYNSNIDTQGLVYPRALYHTMTGIYLAQIVLIGLFALKGAIGPVILQVIYLIFTVLFQMGLTSAMDPLLRFLPKSLEDVEERLLAAEDGQIELGDSELAKNARSTGGLTGVLASARIPNPLGMMDSQLSKVGFFAKFLHPEKYSNYFELRKVIPTAGIPEITYTPEEERTAYYHPAMRSEMPTLWLPRDVGGVSRQECEHNRPVIGCDDEGAYVDEKGKIRRVDEDACPPGWKQEPMY